MALSLFDYCSELSDDVKENRILRGVTVYVEVWSGNESRCECVKAQLKELGAIVEDKFSAKVKIVVFNDGTLTTYKKAKKKNIPLVSVLWIEESKRLMKKACVKTFRALNLDKYEDPDIFSSQIKFKRPRHIHTFSARKRGQKRKRSDSGHLNDENDPYETYFNPHIFNENAVLVKDGIISTLEQVTGKKFPENEDDDSVPCSQFSAEINKPLTEKLYDRFMEEIKEGEETSSEEDKSSRHSCPSSFDLENVEPSEGVNLNKSATEGMNILSIIDEKYSEKAALKNVQVPITYFFQASRVPTHKPTIVFTGFNFDEVDTLTSVVYNLGGFIIESSVSAKCTHIICSYPPKRTLNILRGIARGCWILSKEWVLKSLEKNRWLDEEEFEMDYFLPAIKKARVSRQNGPPFHHRSLFSSCGPIFVSNGCSPPSDELKELISLCGGHLVSTARAARVIVLGQGKNNLISVSQRYSNPPKLVTEKWILDSMSDDILQPFVHPYLMQVRRNSTE